MRDFIDTVLHIDSPEEVAHLILRSDIDFSHEAFKRLRVPCMTFNHGEKVSFSKVSLYGDMTFTMPYAAELNFFVYYLISRLVNTYDTADDYTELTIMKMLLWRLFKLHGNVGLKECIKTLLDSHEKRCKKLQSQYQSAE